MVIALKQKVIKCGLSFLIACLAGFWLQTNAQSVPLPSTEEIKQGMLALDQGQYTNALKLLKLAVRKERGNQQAIAWYYLGVAQTKLGHFKDSLKSFESAIKINPKYAAPHTAIAVIQYSAGNLEMALTEVLKALTLDMKDQQAHSLLARIYARQDKWDESLREVEYARQLFPHENEILLLQIQAMTGLFGMHAFVSGQNKDAGADMERKKAWLSEQRVRLENAAALLAGYLKLPEIAEANWWREQLTAMYAHIQQIKEEQQVVQDGKGDTQKYDSRPKITYREKAVYTQQARNLHISGTVMLRAIFSPQGTLEYLLVLKGLEGGLSQEAIKAAQKVRFEPALRGGIPIPTIVVLEYTFNLY